MRSLLTKLGYHVHGFELGRNIPSAELIARLRDRLADLRITDGRSTSIVGWSLGGIYARLIAREEPGWVRLVITLGSPFRPVPGEESIAAPFMRGASPGYTDGYHAGVSDEPVPVPSTAIFTRSDGIVPWRACVDTVGGPHETIEVTGSHCGLGHHPAVLWVVADRLRQPAGGWRPMVIPPPLRPLLRRHPGR